MKHDKSICKEGNEGAWRAYGWLLIVLGIFAVAVRHIWFG